MGAVEGEVLAGGERMVAIASNRRELRDEASPKTRSTPPLRDRQERNMPDTFFAGALSPLIAMLNELGLIMKATVETTCLPSGSV
jgi:hypothetical protein